VPHRDWSHVALLLNDADFAAQPQLAKRFAKCRESFEGCGVSDAGVYVFESIPGYGATMDSLENWMRDCKIEDGAYMCAGVRQLERPVGHEFDFGRIVDLLGRHQKADYTEQADEFVRCVFRLNNSENPDHLFCSELVTLVLAEIGVVQSDVLVNNTVPGDFYASHAATHMDIQDYFHPGFALTGCVRLLDTTATDKDGGSSERAAKAAPTTVGDWVSVGTANLRSIAGATHGRVD